MGKGIKVKFFKTLIYKIHFLLLEKDDFSGARFLFDKAQHFYSFRNFPSALHINYSLVTPSPNQILINNHFSFF